MARTVRVPVNAPSAYAAETAVMAEMRKRGMVAKGITAETTAGANRPDAEVAIVVTKPAGRRSTFTVFVDLA